MKSDALNGPRGSTVKLKIKFGTHSFSTSGIDLPEAPMTVSCHLCSASVVEGLSQAHWQWHVRHGDVEDDTATKAGPPVHQPSSSGRSAP
jgi:hypothetical protein